MSQPAFRLESRSCFVLIEPNTSPIRIGRVHAPAPFSAGVSREQGVLRLDASGRLSIEPRGSNKTEKLARGSIVWTILNNHIEHALIDGDMIALSSANAAARIATAFTVRRATAATSPPALTTPPAPIPAIHTFDARQSPPTPQPVPAPALAAQCKRTTSPSAGAGVPHAKRITMTPEERTPAPPPPPPPPPAAAPPEPALVAPARPPTLAPPELSRDSALFSLPGLISYDVAVEEGTFDVGGGVFDSSVESLVFESLPRMPLKRAQEARDAKPQLFSQRQEVSLLSSDDEDADVEPQASAEEAAEAEAAAAAQQARDNDVAARSSCTFYGIDATGGRTCSHDGKCFQRSPEHYMQFAHPCEISKPYCPKLLRGEKCFNKGAEFEQHNRSFSHGPLPSAMEAARMSRPSSSTSLSSSSSSAARPHVARPPFASSSVPHAAAPASAPRAAASSAAAYSAAPSSFASTRGGRPTKRMAAACTMLTAARRVAPLPLFVAHAILTMRRNVDWRSNLALLDSDVRHQPTNIKLRYNLGVVLTRDATLQRQEEALLHLREARRCAWPSAARRPSVLALVLACSRACSLALVLTCSRACSLAHLLSTWCSPQADASLPRGGSHRGERAEGPGQTRGG